MGVPKVMVEGAVDSGRLAATGTVKTYGKIENIEVTMNSQNTLFFQLVVQLMIFSKEKKKHFLERISFKLATSFKLSVFLWIFAQ